VPGNYDVKVQLACLAIHIILDFNPYLLTAQKLEADLIQSHMRVVHWVSNDYKIMSSEYPSELVLVEAAAQIINNPPYGSPSPIKTLAEALSQGFLTQGEGYFARGERLGGQIMQRLLWIMAHDAAAKKQTIQDNPEIQYHVPVPVIDFLKALVNPKWHDIILKALPVTVTENSQTLQDTFANAYVNFSHFTQTTDSEVLHCCYLYASLVTSGSTIQC
jgi:hypothetical protein